MSLEACLPANLRDPTTTITRITAGLSGAEVYRVEAAGQVFVLKRASESVTLAAWRDRVHIQQLAASANLAPPVVHVDEEQRAVLSAFVGGLPFVAHFRDPHTRDAAIAQLGQTLRRVHDLPLPPDAEAKDPRELLAALWSGLAQGFVLPAFVGDAVQRMLEEQAPPLDRPPVLSHNDVNPTNLAYDGERLLFLDWDTAGPNDPYYDLAAIAVFLCMDEPTCLQLISAHDGAQVSDLPARFVYGRRLVAILCGTAFLHLARQVGHAGASAAETLEAVPSLPDFYQRLQAGSLSIASSEGQWAFGLALMKTGTSL
jgi:thiamine kinase-like enzyme